MTSALCPDAVALSRLSVTSCQGRSALPFQQLAEESFGGFLITARLDEYYESHHDLPASAQHRASEFSLARSPPSVTIPMKTSARCLLGHRKATLPYA